MLVLELNLGKAIYFSARRIFKSSEPNCRYLVQWDGIYSNFGINSDTSGELWYLKETKG